jgi:hypothetical protein
MFDYTIKKILTCFLLIVVGYFIAKMFSQKCNGFSVGAQINCESIKNPAKCHMHLRHGCELKDGKCGYKNAQSCNNNQDCNHCKNADIDKCKQGNISGCKWNDKNSTCIPSINCNNVNINDCKQGNIDGCKWNDKNSTCSPLSLSVCENNICQCIDDKLDFKAYPPCSSCKNTNLHPQAVDGGATCTRCARYTRDIYSDPPCSKCLATGKEPDIIKGCPTIGVPICKGENIDSDKFSNCVCTKHMNDDPEVTCKYICKNNNTKQKRNVSIKSNLSKCNIPWQERDQFSKLCYDNESLISNITISNCPSK